MSGKMTKAKVTLDPSIVIEKSIEGVLQYKVESGMVTWPLPTECDKKLQELRDCLRENVVVRSYISPEAPPYWAWDERAFLIVRVYNKTAFFRLEDVDIRLLRVRALEGRASVSLESGPTTKTIDYIWPGWSRTVSFPLVCDERFDGDERVVGQVSVACRAIPHVREYSRTEEELLRGG